jgi:hypothetical protein
MRVDLKELEGIIPMHDKRYERLSESVNEEYKEDCHSQRTVSTTVAYTKSVLLIQALVQEHSRRHSME